MKWRWKIAQAAEVRWWQNYLKGKSKEDYLKWKKAYWQQFLTDCELSVAEGATCLDAGCGPAGIFTILEEQVVEAVDPLLADYEERLEHFDPKDYPWVNFVTSPLEQYQATKAYDYVFCLNAINHVADLNQSMDQLFSLTKDGGILVVSIDAHNYSIFKHIFRIIPGDILHPHQYDLQEYQAMISNRGGQLLHTFCKQEAFFFDYYVLVVRVARASDGS